MISLAYSEYHQAWAYQLGYFNKNLHHLDCYCLISFILSNHMRGEENKFTIVQYAF